MNILERFFAQAGQRPNALALVDSRGGEWTFSALREAGGRAATMLSADGVSRGDRVLLLIPMSAELYILLLGLFQLGAVAAFVDPTAAKTDLIAAVERIQPKALLAVDRARWLTWRWAVFRRIAIKRYRHGLGLGAGSWQRWKAYVPRTAYANIPKDAPALITFTSGSTGQPKGIVRSHGLLLAQHDRLRDTIALEPGEVDYTTLPVFVFANLGSGICSVLPNKASSASVTRRRMERCEVNRVTAAPAFFEPFLHEKSPPMENLRKVFTGGGPVSLELLRRMQQKFPSARIEAVYGSSEAEPMAHTSLVEWETVAAIGKGLLAGRIDAGTTVHVIKDQFPRPVSFPSLEAWQDAQCPTDAMGEIVVTGDHVVQRYLDGVGQAVAKFEAAGRRWHRTGDAGYFDASGRLWLGGRCEGSAAVGDRILYPFVVENAVSSIRGLARSAWVEVDGSATLAIELEPEADLSAVVPQIEEALEGLGLKRSLVRVVRKIPMDRRHASKIDYRRLQAILASR